MCVEFAWRFIVHCLREHNFLSVDMIEVRNFLNIIQNILTGIPIFDLVEPSPSTNSWTTITYTEGFA